MGHALLGRANRQCRYPAKMPGAPAHWARTPRALFGAEYCAHMLGTGTLSQHSVPKRFTINVLRGQAGGKQQHDPHDCSPVGEGRGYVSTKQCCQGSRGCISNCKVAMQLTWKYSFCPYPQTLTQGVNPPKILRISSLLYCFLNYHMHENSEILYTHKFIFKDHIFLNI